MGVYTEWALSYAREAVAWGTGGIADASTQTYLLGALSKRSKHPSPRASIHYGPTAVNAREVAAGYVWKSKFDSVGSYSIVMQNGILLELTMGKSATAGGGPYTHTITPTADGSDLPSITLQFEQSGTATDWATQFLGVKVASLSLLCSEKGYYLIGATNVIAKSALDPGYMMTSTPTLPPTATTTPYKFSGMTRTWDYGAGNVALDGLIELELNISPNIEALYTANWTAGVWTGQWPTFFVERARKQYSLTLHLQPESDDLWDELISLSNTKELYLKWTKSANDYIAATLTDCQLIYHELVTPDQGSDEPDYVEVVIEPRAVSFSVVDSIAGGYYGE